MTNKEKLIKFMKKKDAFLYEKTKMHIMDEEDYIEIISWNEELCTMIVESIKEALKSKYKTTDASLCPWCIRSQMIAHNDPLFSERADRLMRKREYELREIAEEIDWELDEVKESVIKYCLICNYGIRHRICDLPGSTYTNIVEDLPISNLEVTMEEKKAEFIKILEGE